MLGFICIMIHLTEKPDFIKENTIRGQILLEQNFHLTKDVIIALECGLDMRIVQSSPGDSNVHSRVRTNVWIPGATSSWRIWLPGQSPIPALEEL